MWAKAISKREREKRAAKHHIDLEREREDGRRKMVNNKKNI